MTEINFSEDRNHLDSILKECKRFLKPTHSNALSQLEASLSDGKIPSVRVLDNLAGELINFGHQNLSEEERYTRAAIANHILCNLVGIENSHHGEFASYIWFSIFGIDDENSSWVQKVDLKYIDY